MRGREETDLPSSNVLQARYGRGYFHGENSGFSELGYDAVHGDFRYLLPFLAAEAGEGATVLDLGCAYGFLCEELAQAGFRTIGFDVSLYALHEGRARLSELALAAARGENLPLGDDSVDVVLALDMLEHVPAPEQVLAECARVLRPGGLLFFATPDPLRFTGEEETHEAERVPSWWIEVLAELGFNASGRFFQAPWNFEVAARLRGVRPALCWDQLGVSDPLFEVVGDARLDVLLREGFETPPVEGSRGASDGAVLYLRNDGPDPLRVSVRVRKRPDAGVGLRMDGIEWGTLSVEEPVVLRLPVGGHEVRLAVERGWLRLPPLVFEAHALDVASFRDDLPADLQERYRHGAAVALALGADRGRILDVGGTMGGAEGHLGWAGDFFPAADVEVVDTRATDHPRHRVVEAGDPLPFPDRAFDLVLSHDVLEHVPVGARDDWLQETWRVCGGVLVLGAPFAEAGVVEADRRLRESIRTAYGYDHQFLAEHFRFGHPDLESTCGLLRAWGAEVAVLPSGYLPAWELCQQISAELSHPCQEPAWLAANREMNRVLGADGLCAPAYRQLVVADRHGRDLQSHLAGLVASEPPDMAGLATVASLVPPERWSLRVLQGATVGGGEDG